MPEPIVCYRCSQPGYCVWIEVTGYDDPEPDYILGESYCLTPGCADLDGSRRLQPLSPQELRDRESSMWLAHHRALTQD